MEIISNVDNFYVNYGPMWTDAILREGRHEFILINQHLVVIWNFSKYLLKSVNLRVGILWLFLWYKSKYLYSEIDCFMFKLYDKYRMFLTKNLSIGAVKEKCLTNSRIFFRSLSFSFLTPRKKLWYFKNFEKCLF